MASSCDFIYKILIVGDSCVGKSCLLLQFSDKTFSENYVSTIGVDFKIRTIDLNDRQIKLQIWDTAGQERFQSITANYYHGSHAIAIVYDITNRKSFENIRKWLSDVDRLANPLVCKFIIGNKEDLSDKRAVSTEEGQEFANKLGVPFMETSAKTAYNVQEMFTRMTEAIYNRQGNQTTTSALEMNLNNFGRGETIGNNCPC